MGRTKLAELSYERISRGSPEVDNATIVTLLAKNYDLDVLRCSRLGGEIDQNVRIEASDGRTYVVKIAGDLADETQLRWQNVVLRHLAQQAPELPLPRLLPGSDGLDLQRILRGDRVNIARTLTWLPGHMLVELDRHSPELLAEFGRSAGELANALATLTAPAPVTSHHWDLRQAPDAVEACLPWVADPEDRWLVERTMRRFTDVASGLDHLPTGVVHQDLNDFNVLAQPDAFGRHHVSGILDVGDSLRTVRVAEVAVAIAYAMLRKPDPLRAAATVLRGYVSVSPLSELELATVYPLAGARLCVNATTWTRRRALDENAYGASRMRHTWPLLRQLDAVDPQLVEATLRHAGGAPASPAGAALRRAVRATSPASGSSSALGIPSGRLQPVLSPEPVPSDAALEPATLRLASVVDTPVRLPVAATVRERSGERLVLEHELADRPCWSVWTGLRPGVADVGESLPVGTELHAASVDTDVGVTLIAEPELASTLPRTVQPWLRGVWGARCPDPRMLWGIAAETDADTGALPDVLRTRDARLGRSQRYYYRHPMNLVDSRGVWLRDENGLDYLDAINNVTHIGHADERVAAAVSAQMRRLNTNSRFVYADMARYAQRLVELLPDPLEVVYFACTGSEANDLALRIARFVTGREHVIVLDGAYHGNTTAVTAISPDRYDSPGGSGPPPTTHAVIQPNRYRGVFGYDDPEAGIHYAQDVARVITELTVADQPPAAFFAESLMGTAGQIVLPAGYLQRGFELVRAAGGLCVSDEVQVGFGRLGDAFWGFETHGVVPDIVTMGKPMANGLPISAVVTTRAIADQFDRGIKYFNTFGGNPVCCAAGTAVLDAIAADGLQARARTVGRYLQQRLEELSARHDLIGDVRGQGLYAGVELVRDRATREPAAEEAAHVSERMKEQGVIVYPNGRLANILKVKPPMIFEAQHVDRLVDTLDLVLGEDW